MFAMRSLVPDNSKSSNEPRRSVCPYRGWASMAAL